MAHTNDLTGGSISKHLILLSVPLILGNILQQFYNTIDAFVVGRYTGDEAMAAIGIAGTIMNLFLFLIIGSCAGFSVLFARFYGAGEYDKFRRQHFLAFCTGFAGTCLLAALGLLLGRPILAAIQTPVGLMEGTSAYLVWIFASLPAAFLYNLYAALLRSIGDTKAALMILGVAVFCNLFLDLLLVAKFQMGTQGAAAATAVTQLIAAAVCFGYVKRRYSVLLFRRQDWGMDWTIFKTTLHFGIVTALHQSGLYLGKMLVQGAVNSVGTDCIVAYTAATRIEGFVNSFGDSGAAATSVVTAQNYGAGKQERVRRTFFASLFLLVVLGIVCSGILFLTSGFTMKIMLGSSRGASFAEATGYLRIVSLFYVLCFTGNTFAGYFEGIGKVSIPFAGAIGHITLRVILAWLFVVKYQLDAVAVATGIGWVLVNIFWTIMVVRKGSLKREKSVI